MAAKDAKAQEVARKLEEYIEKYALCELRNISVAHKSAMTGFITQNDTQTKSMSIGMSSYPSRSSR